ncbi:MAG: CoA transferase [Rhodospirillales bacterium]|nr:CoA transferase [Rhodospirillales bacterium]
MVSNSESNERTSCPLDGVRVLDFTQILAGPFCTSLLADLGAEVIKVEPLRGDEYRRVGPFKMGESALFQLVNRGKQSVVLDLKNKDGLAAVHSLSASVDVVVENFRPGVAERLGIDYKSLSAINLKLVYASISGFGQHGPLSKRPAYDLVVQAMSGLMYMTGEPDGPPTRVGESFGDLFAGLYASWAILAKLYERERTGCGGYVDIAMFDTLFSMMPTAIAQWMFGTTSPTRVGNRHPLSTPFGEFKTCDGYLIIAVLNNIQFSALCDVMGMPELTSEKRFSNDELRTENEPDLKKLIEGWSTRHDTRTCVESLSDAGVPASPIWSMEEAIESVQVSARSLLRTAEHSKIGSIPMMEQPVQFEGAPRGITAPAPDLGEHTSAVLSNLEGLSSDILSRLCDEKGSA